MGGQLSFFRRLRCEPARIEHGGEVRRGRRKLSRPIDLRRPLHVVMRASRARGRWGMRTRGNERLVGWALRRFAARYRIRVYEFANADNHLHLLLRTSTRLELQNFLRAFAGVTARLITRARKGFRVGRFWDFLSYSRVVTWGRDFRTVRSYVIENRFEALGLIAYRPRRKTNPPRGHLAELHRGRAPPSP
jgi:REP element-mobilizing transposase RayT